MLPSSKEGLSTFFKVLSVLWVLYNSLHKGKEMGGKGEELRDVEKDGTEQLERGWREKFWSNDRCTMLHLAGNLNSLQPLPED